MLLAALTFAGLTLGMPAGDLRPSFGDPLRILTFQDGGRRAARYLSPDSSGLIVVIEERGYVQGVGIFAVTKGGDPSKIFPADPNGVVLGDTIQTVESRRLDARKQTDDKGAVTIVGKLSPEAGYSYEFKDGKVASIYWGVPVPKGAPDLPALTEPDGGSPAGAITIVQNSEMTGVQWEYRFLAFHPCDGDTGWKLQQQSIVRDGTRSFDRLHVICPTTKAERDYYFDITSYFGKL